MWLVKDGMVLDPIRGRIIWEYLNIYHFPFRYRDIERLTAFQNRVFAKYAAAHGLPFIDVAGRMPFDANGLCHGSLLMGVGAGSPARLPVCSNCGVRRCGILGRGAAFCQPHQLRLALARLNRTNSRRSQAGAGCSLAAATGIVALQAYRQGSRPWDAPRGMPI